MSKKKPTEFADLTSQSVSARIRARLSLANAPFRANHSISSFVYNEDERAALVEEVADKMQGVLDALVINTEDDHNTKDTAKRVAKMFVNEWFAGRYTPAPDTTEFPNVMQMNQLYVVGPIELRSVCAHHFVPITGHAWVGILPDADGNVIGLSKFSRMIAHLAARPQIQEELTQQVADELEETLKPLALHVIIKAKHMCCGHRGIKDSGQFMVTSVCRGAMLDDPTLRNEFLQLVRMVDNG